MTAVKATMTVKPLVNVRTSAGRATVKRVKMMRVTAARATML